MAVIIAKIEYPSSAPPLPYNFPSLITGFVGLNPSNQPLP